MNYNLKIIPINLFEDYLRKIPGNLEASFNALKDAEISTGTFSFYTSVSSVFSCKIEGVDIELDSYIKHKKFGIEFQVDYTKKTDDLYEAYQFAQSANLNAQAISEAHKLLSKHIVANHQQGKLRTNNMYVATSDGKIEYVAATPFELVGEMGKFYADIEILIQQPLTFAEVFYFAAMIHLVFVKIHPWNDGNGRTGRLLEKWFISQKLGGKAWFIQSEKNYYEQQQVYYNNLRLLGLEYSELDYKKAISFLLMLPDSVIKYK